MAVVKGGAKFHITKQMLYKYLIPIMISEQKSHYSDVKLFDISFEIKKWFITYSRFNLRSFSAAGYLTRLISNIKGKDNICHFIVSFDTDSKFPANKDNSFLSSQECIIIEQRPFKKELSIETLGCHIYYLTVKDDTLWNIQDIIRYVDKSYSSECYIIFGQEQNR